MLSRTIRWTRVGREMWSVALLVAVVAAWGAGGAMAESPKPAPGRAPDGRSLPSDDQLKRTLTPGQFHITRECGTEPPFANAYWNNKQAGLYVDVITGEPLFSSKDKFDSGTGWPSFTRPLQEQSLQELTDDSLGVTRVEVRAASSGSHLGHVFDDGPGPEGLRYCINSASLRFVPVERLEAEGYGQFLAQFARGKAGRAAEAPSGSRVAIFAGGCFWGVEEAFRRTPGVTATEVGYTGGATPKPTYEEVCTSDTGHVEAVRVTFDSSKVSYEALLERFWAIHDPTTPNRQGPDVGPQYRSAVFTLDAAQAATARAVRDRLAASGKVRRPIVTEIVPAGVFTRAEEYHQQYMVKHPERACHLNF